MGNIGGGEILIVLLAALIFLGPSKLPEAARQIGKAMGEFRKVTSGFQRELRDAMNDADDTSKRITNAPKPVDAVVTEPVTEPVAEPVPEAAVAPSPAVPAVEPEPAPDLVTDPAAETSSDR
jgi:sec-independent protein translocase protein TatB